MLEYCFVNVVYLELWKISDLWMVFNLGFRSDIMVKLIVLKLIVFSLKIIVKELGVWVLMLWIVIVDLVFVLYFII